MLQISAFKITLRSKISHIRAISTITPKKGLPVSLNFGIKILLQKKSQKMKKQLLTLLLALTTLSVFGQNEADTTYWAKGGNFSLNFSQVGLSNWAGGGDPSIALGSLYSLVANYEKDVHLWQNRFEAAYGVQRLGGDENSFMKTDDNLLIASNYNRKLTEKLFATALLDFRTQMDVGYSFDDMGNKTRVSTFLAPGYLKLGIGASLIEKYSDTDFFSVTFTPATAKFTFVKDDKIVDAAFAQGMGVYGLDPGDKSRTEFGANLGASLQRDIAKNVRLQTNLSLFSSYADASHIDVNWDGLLLLKVNKYITSSIGAQMIYDHDIILTKDDGSEGRATQFKNIFNLGLSVDF